MTRTCSITGKTVMTGNNVSHSNRKTKRRFLPNVKQITFKSNLLRKEVSLKISTNTLRSIEKSGGIDEFLLKSKANNLTEEGRKLRRQMKEQANSNKA